VERWSADATRFVSDVGAPRLALYLAAAIAAMVSISVLVATARRER
jgi:hypothetical protein